MGKLIEVEPARPRAARPPWTAQPCSAAKDPTSILPLSTRGGGKHRPQLFNQSARLFDVLPGLESRGDLAAIVADFGGKQMGQAAGEGSGVEGFDPLADGEILDAGGVVVLVVAEGGDGLGDGGGEGLGGGADAAVMNEGGGAGRIWPKGA